MIQFDFSGLHELRAEIEGADTKVRRNVRTAVKTAAFRGKKMWAGAARSHMVDGSLAGYPPSIDYDIEGVGRGNTSGEIVAEIGPRVGGGGSLAIVEEAPGGVRGTPQRNREKIQQPLTEDLVRGILIAVGDGMGGT